MSPNCAWRDCLLHGCELPTSCECISLARCSRNCCDLTRFERSLFIGHTRRHVSPSTRNNYDIKRQDNICLLDWVLASTIESFGKKRRKDKERSVTFIFLSLTFLWVWNQYKDLSVWYKGTAERSDKSWVYYKSVVEFALPVWPGKARIHYTRLYKEYYKYRVQEYFQEYYEFQYKNIFQSTTSISTRFGLKVRPFRVKIYIVVQILQRVWYEY